MQTQVLSSSPGKKHTVTGQAAVLVVLHMTQEEYLTKVLPALAPPAPPCVACKFTLKKL